MTQIVDIRNTAQLLAIVPRLLGFVPENSLVVIGTETLRERVRVTMRYDLPDPPDSGIAVDMAKHVATALAQENITAAIIVGYGPGRLVTPLVDALRAVELPPLRDILR